MKISATMVDGSGQKMSEYGRPGKKEEYTVLEHQKGRDILVCNGVQQKCIVSVWSLETTSSFIDPHWRAQ